MFRILDILVQIRKRIRIRLAVLWLTDPDADPAPDPALFFSDLQDGNNKYLFFYQVLKVHLHHSSKIKSHKEVPKRRQIREAQKNTDPTDLYPGCGSGSRILISSTGSGKVPVSVVPVCILRGFLFLPTVFIWREDFSVLLGNEVSPS